jgi:hypothetical protein
MTNKNAQVASSSETDIKEKQHLRELFDQLDK